MARKNILKIPTKIKTQIETFSQDDVVVACVKYIPNEEINRYKHLNIRYINGELVVPPSRTPNPNAGKFSRANLEGLEKKELIYQKSQKNLALKLQIGMVMELIQFLTIETYFKKIFIHPKKSN